MDTDCVDTLTALNSYRGTDLWADVIARLPVDSTKTGARSFTLLDGTCYEFDLTLQAWRVAAAAF